MVVHDGQVAVEVPRAVNQYAGPAWPLLDPSLGDHPAVADQHQVGQLEAVPDVGGQVGECGRVGGVAGHHPHRNRPPDRVGEQPVLDLRQPLLAVPGVAAGRQRAVRAGHPGAGQIEQREPVGVDRLALFDLSSSWMTGSHCPLAARGYSRDGKKGLPQIEYGLLTDPVGRPVAVRVVAGNTADPTAFAHLATDVRDRFGLTDLVLVGDRGMITKARIEQLRDLGGLRWVTALRAPDVAALARDDGPLQMSLFDQANLAEITHPDFPDERLIACCNRARSAASAGLRQAIRRSSGKSGWVISARFAWSNRLICSGPSSRASAATSGARRAVTQPRPPRSRSCSIRALVIIPRSPTSTRSVNPKRSRTSVARWANAVGSAVLPATTRTATGRPTGSVSSPYSICGSPFLPSREYPRAANGQCEPVIQELDRSNSASRSGLTGALRCRSANAASMASWHSRSQSIAAYASSVLTSVRPRSADRVVSVHQRVVASFEPGRQR